ncbi:MAG: HAMP domain-containing histidine kinase, partial [Lachnospiraceae bacterium]|nr:HAMP domain-containing histidine kinase [Lachnospiraceae bacterium]
MKVRYLAAFYTAIMILILVLLINLFSDSKPINRDMIYYNEQMHMVTRELEMNENRDRVEEKYGCDIIFLNDNDYKIRLNRLIQDGAVIIDYYEDGNISGKIAWNDQNNYYLSMKDDLYKKAALVWGLILLSGYLLLLFIYIYVIFPFKKLQTFSSQIAKGNFDFRLPIQKNNFFGAFTESFDIMREELKRAKEGEYQANRSKKELVAELSHDIKTPISTIKATCEVMQLKEENKDTLDKISVIMSKADMVDKLIGNMFHATLEELEVLTVEPAEESSLCILEMLQEIQYYGEIVFQNSVPECLVYIDRIRLQQVVDNIINNTYKYAQTATTVIFHETEDGIIIKLRDEGAGVPEEEAALITDKFYRGSNTNG